MPRSALKSKCNLSFSALRAVSAPFNSGKGEPGSELLKHEHGMNAHVRTLLLVFAIKSAPGLPKSLTGFTASEEALNAGRSGKAKKVAATTKAALDLASDILSDPEGRRSARQDGHDDGATETIKVKVPKGVKVGDTMDFTLPGGVKIKVAVPKGVRTGQLIPVKVATNRLHPTATALAKGGGYLRARSSEAFYNLLGEASQPMRRGPIPEGSRHPVNRREKTTFVHYHEWRRGPLFYKWSLSLSLCLSVCLSVSLALSACVCVRAYAHPLAGGLTAMEPLMGDGHENLSPAAKEALVSARKRGYSLGVLVVTLAKMGARDRVLAGLPIAAEYIDSHIESAKVRRGEVGFGARQKDLDKKASLTTMPLGGDPGGGGSGGCMGCLNIFHHLYRPHYDTHSYIPARYALGTIAEVRARESCT